WADADYAGDRNEPPTFSNYQVQTSLQTSLLNEDADGSAVRVQCAVEVRFFRPKSIISSEHDLFREPALTRSTIVGGRTVYISKEGAAITSRVAFQNPTLAS